MKRFVLAGVAFLLCIAACSGGSTGNVRTVLVDYSHDEYASLFLKFFPGALTVAQGDEVLFRQTWTGEPHSVTGGTLVNDLMKVAEPYKKDFEAGKALPTETPPKIAAAAKKLVRALDAEDTFNQTAAQPCYLEAGEELPKNGDPCRRRTQPAFSGTEPYYNSGILTSEGLGSNEFRVKLADDIKPGEYWFYCNVHGQFQSTKLQVKAKGVATPPQETVNKRVRKEIDVVAQPLLKLFRNAEDGTVTVRDPSSGQGTTLRGRFAGLIDPKVPAATVNEFIPREVKVKRGDQLTWHMIGGHSISFGVPRSFPIVRFRDDGTVSRNPDVFRPVGGPEPFDAPERGRSSAPQAYDAGTYDGSGFWSTGVIAGDPWVDVSMRITKKGKYTLACLIHPLMVGTVEVT